MRERSSAGPARDAGGRSESPEVAAVFVRWVFLRAVLHRGWWLVTSLYLVVDAQLSPVQLVLVGTAQSVTGLVFEVPTGVLADTVSRRLSLLVSHALMGLGMLATGLVTSFPALAGTQMTWGLSWTFASGADVAWLTDELDEPERAARVLARAGRFEQGGAACGMLAFGALAWATSLQTSILVAGAGMWVLGALVVARFPERGFVPRPAAGRWRASLAIFRRGRDLARRDRQVRLVLLATLLVNGANEGFGRLYAKHLVDLGLPAEPDPIVWLAALGLVCLAAGAASLRVVEARIDGENAARTGYALACAAGALGLALLAVAPDERSAMAGVVLVAGVAQAVTRCVSVVWVNRRATSEVRATLQSLLSQSEYAGEIALGACLGVLAELAGIPWAMLGGGALVAMAGVRVARRRDEARPAVG